MLIYIQRVVYLLFPLIFVACGGGGNNNLDKTPPTIELNGKSHIRLTLNEPYHELGAKALDNTDTNLNILISNGIHPNIPGVYNVTYSATDSAGNKAIKQRKVEVVDITPSNTYTTPSNLQKHTFKLDSKTIPSIAIDIQSSKTIQAVDTTSMHANDITLHYTNNTYILRNNSYKNIKNLIGQYTDEENITHLVKLTFDRILKSHTAYLLKDFIHANTMKIYQTSELFNQTVTFEGTLCNQNLDNSNQVKYCKPTPTEQKNYELLLSNLHYFYNTPDGLKSFLAWKNKKNYRSINLTSTFQDFEEMQKSNLIHSFLKATLPNNQTKLKTAYNLEEHAGVGAGEEVSLLGIRENKGWAALQKKYIEFSPETILDDTNVYTLFHHELMHARGFSHTSGMTIGFSNALGKVITQLYPYDTIPVFDVPKYVFEVHFEKNKQMHLTLYHTSPDYSDKLTVELLSVEEMSTKLVSSNGDGQIIIETKREPSMRFFLRLYGEESTQIMSKLIYPSQFSKFLEKTKTDKKYSIISYKNWQYLAKHNTEYLKMTPRDAEAFCRAWTGEDRAHTTSLREMKIWEEEEDISLLLHSPYTDTKYYIVSNGEDREIAYNTPMEEEATAITCIVK